LGVLPRRCVARGGYVLLGDMLPAFIYFPTTAVGIALLLASR
jgi:hypothetical protein